MSSGYIKLHRSIMDNPAWTAEPFSRQQAWIDLIMLANHAPAFVRIAGRKIDVGRGQLAWSLLNLANRWQWSSGKVSRFINELKTMHQIEHQNKVVTSVMTIINYDRYQSNDVTDGIPDGGPDRGPDGDQIDDQTVDKQEGTRRERIRNTPLPPLNGGNEVELFSDFLQTKKMPISWSPSDGWENIDTETIERWSSTYPACDIDHQLKVMHEWLLSNTQKAHKTNWMRFITNWLKREQDKGGDMRRLTSSETPRIAQSHELSTWAIQERLKACRNELRELKNPGGSAMDVTLTGEKLNRAEHLVAVIAELKKQLTSNPNQ